MINFSCDLFLDMHCHLLLFLYIYYTLYIQVYTADVETIFQLLFTDANFFRDFLMARNTISTYSTACVYTVEPPNNGHFGDEHFVHCSEVVPYSEVEMYG